MFYAEDKGLVKWQCTKVQRGLWFGMPFLFSAQTCVILVYVQYRTSQTLILQILYSGFNLSSGFWLHRVCVPVLSLSMWVSTGFFSSFQAPKNMPAGRLLAKLLALKW